MEDFKILTHEVIGDLTDVCNFVTHKFTFNKECYSYSLDEGAVIVESTSVEIRYPRGQEFKVTFYDEERLGNLLVIGTDATGAIGSNAFFTIDNVSKLSDVLVRFTYKSLISGSCVVQYELNTLLPGDYFDVTLSLDNVEGDYDYTGLPFIFSSKSNDFEGLFSMRIISSTADQNPFPDTIELTAY